MQFILDFADRWLGGILEITGFYLGVLVCVASFGLLWEKKIRWPVGLLLITAGAAFILLYLHIDDLGISAGTGIAHVLLGIGFSCFSGIILFRERARRKRNDDPAMEAMASLFSDSHTRRGITLATGLIIILSVSAVAYVGLNNAQVMIGDEVTHYYMLENQAKDLSKPNFFAEIPVGTDGVETRRYPHPFFWHYGGALISSISGHSFRAIQLYQAFFFFQLLFVAWLMARQRGGVLPSVFLYVTVIASLPLSLLFSVAFYQDVPLTAQILTAFYLLRRKRWLWASLFMALAIGFKVTAMLFFPIFFVLLFYWKVKESGFIRGGAVLVVSLCIVLGVTWGVGRAIVTYSDSNFYPYDQLSSVVNKTKGYFDSHFTDNEKKQMSESSSPSSPEVAVTAPVVRQKYVPIIANHPGDLRIKENYLIYLGIVFWLFSGLGLIGYGVRWLRPAGTSPARQSGLWLYLVGGSYLLLASWFTRTAPDARFLLPGLPFVLLPLSEMVILLPKPRWLVVLLTALALVQGYYVLDKTSALRSLTAEMTESIEFLEHQPGNEHIFMYPEGNYRFFNRQHEWYLGYRLREFWRGDNDLRIKMLNEFSVGYIVVKKHLVAPVDETITNLGIYPDQFVRDIEMDTRFTPVFNNAEISIFKVPDTFPGQDRHGR